VRGGTLESPPLELESTVVVLSAPSPYFRRCRGPWRAVGRLRRHPLESSAATVISPPTPSSHASPCSTSVCFCAIDVALTVVLGLTLAVEENRSLGRGKARRRGAWRRS
jgi:hypothetical protein